MVEVRTREKCEGRSVYKYFIAVLFLAALANQYSWVGYFKNLRGPSSVAQHEDHQEICAKRLDTLDIFFDERRNAREGQISLERGKRYFDAYEPDAVCLLEERFGAKLDIRHQAYGDGPKFICGVDYLAEKKSLPNSCLVYSVGSNNNIDFEKAVHKQMKGCEIHTFDPTVETENFVGHHVANFHPWGLGLEGQQLNITRKGKGSYLFQAKSFDTLVKDLGHTGRTIDVLKIDCEGCEWEVMPLVFESIAKGTLSVNQVLIEVHQRATSNLPLFLESADKASMRTFHKERNSLGCDGYRCVEYSLASEMWLREVNQHAMC